MVKLENIVRLTIHSVLFSSISSKNKKISIGKNMGLHLFPF